MLSAIAQLNQWHIAIDPEFGDFFSNHLKDELRWLGKTEGELRMVAYGT